MTRTPLVSLLVVATGFGAGLAVAQETTPVLKPASPAPAVSTPRPRAISPAVSAQLAAATPKFDAVTPAVAPKTTEPAPDLRETDKPRNTIIRLPNYLVQEDRPAVMKERELYTPQGRLDRALKKFPGLNLGSFWIFRNDGIALFMAEEEERLDRMKEMNELVSLLPPSQQREMKPVVDRTFMRVSDPR